MKTTIEMAHEAGLHLATDVNWMPIIGLEYAEKLIALARADEREACERCKQLEEQAYDLLGRLQAANLSIAMLKQIAELKERNK